MTITTNPSTAQPKRNRSATTNTVLKPSKSARIVSTRSNNQPLPTRSSPSAATKKTSTSTKTNQRLQTSKPALKKSSSLSTASNNHRCDHHIIQQPQPRRLLRCNSSGKTKMQEVTELQTLLEKSRQEQRALSQQMDGQEAAWDRLVSAKESYAVLVQEKDNEIARLKRFIDQTNQATDQLAKLANEKDAAQTRASMSEAMEKQHSKIIERLDARVQSLQQEALQIAQRHEAEALDRNAQMEQLREQLAERDEAAAIIERECGELRKTHIETVRAFESSITALKVDHAQMIQNKDAQIARLQQMLQDVHQIYPTVQEEENDMSPRRRLEAQLELSTRELDREREMIKSLQVEVEQLKEEIKRLHHVSVNSNSQFYALRNELDNEIQDKRRIMEEANAALEIQARTEEENERIKLTNDKTQRDLADVLKKLATMEKQQRGPDEVHYLMNKNRELEAQNEKLQAAQRQSEHECMRLMDELLAIEKVGSESNTNVAGDKIYRREIEQLKLQVVRETKRYNDLLDSKDAKCERLTKELADLESLVENKVFNETELEEAVENEKRKVRALELKLREEEEKNMHLISKQQQQYAPMSPTSPQYSLFHRQQHQSKVSSTGSFSLMTSSSLDTVSDHGNMLESVYCEICEVYGHEVMTCNAFMTEKDNISSSSVSVL
jgi:DNA repair exonuclease SbcCD ATPase subunit